MSQQLYARVFVQILDSSLAEDWQTRHVFEDLLKLADGGIVDMTRQAIARRTNAPLDIINDAIAKLEAPDPASRDEAEEGRRIVRLDDHRDWGWRIVNWDKYEAIKSREQDRAKVRERVQRHRERQRLSKHSSPRPPTDSDPSSYSEGALPKRYDPLQTVTNEEKRYSLRGWPTQDALLALADMRGVPRDVAEAFWLDADARGGCDSKGVPILRVESALLAYNARWRANGSNLGKPASTRPRIKPDHSKGF